MSERSPHRRPATFKLDDPGVVVMDPDEQGHLARGTVRVTPEPDPALLPVPLEAPMLPARPGFRWGTLFWTALGGLVLLGLGLSITQSDRGSVCAQRRPGFRRAGMRGCRGAGVDRRDRARGDRAGAARHHREDASARHRSAAQRRSRRQPDHRRRICSSWSIRIRNWPAPAPRCSAMPTTSSTALT